MTIVIVPRYAIHMNAREETSRTRTSGKRQPARERIVRSAAALVRERGIHGVGLRQISCPCRGPARLPAALLPGREDAADLRGPQTRRHRGTRRHRVQGSSRRPRSRMRSTQFSPLGAAVFSRSATSRWDVPWPPRLQTPAETTGYGMRLALSSISGVTPYTPSWSEFGVDQSTAEDDASVLLAALEGCPYLEPSRPKHPTTRHGAALFHRVADAGRSQPC